jgi:hypothetical protein
MVCIGKQVFSYLQIQQDAFLEKAYPFMRF